MIIFQTGCSKVHYNKTDYKCVTKKQQTSHFPAHAPLAGQICVSSRDQLCDWRGSTWSSGREGLLPQSTFLNVQPHRTLLYDLQIFARKILRLSTSSVMQLHPLKSGHKTRQGKYLKYIVFFFYNL